MDTNCLISKQIYQFLPGGYVKMRAISKLYSLKIATHVSDVIVFFGDSFGPSSTDTNSKGFRIPPFKHTSLNSSRDTSAQKSICEAAELLPCSPLHIAIYISSLWPIEGSLFFHMQHKEIWSTYAFPQKQSHGPKVLLYTQESRFAFLTSEDQEALLPCNLQKGKVHFHLKTKIPVPLCALQKP